MRTAYLTPTFSSFSGIDHVVRNQAKRALEHGHDVTIVCLDADMELEGARIVKLGLPRDPLVQRVYRLGAFFDRSLIRRGSQAIRDADEAIAHFYPMTFIAGAAKKRFGVRYVYWNHGFAHPRAFSSLLERVYVWCMRFLLPFSLRNVDEAVSISGFLKNELKRETGLESRVEHNEIDQSSFNENVEPKDVREKHGIGDAPLFLYVGRITSHKGIHLLLAAFKRVKDELPDARLLIVGQSRSESYLERLKNMRTDGVEFVGFVDELPKYYAAADVYVTASLWEGYNLTIAEANACNTPAVAFDIGPHREVIEKGSLVRAGSLKDLAEGMIAVYADVRSGNRYSDR